MSDIIGIGASVYDTLMLVSRFPQEDTKLQAFETMTQGGGPCATALVAAGQLGVSTAYMGILGDDSYGRFSKQVEIPLTIDYNRPLFAKRFKAFRIV